MTDHTHLLTIFDQPTPDIVYASDFLRFTPKEIMHLAYCVNEDEFAKAVEPIKESVIFGPPVGCCGGGNGEMIQTIYPQGVWSGQQAAWSPQHHEGYPPYTYGFHGRNTPQNNNVYDPYWANPYSY